MARINLYVSKELESVYEKAKEFAGDSISSLFGEFMTKYVACKEAELKGMGEVPLIIGTVDYGNNSSSLAGIKFFGRSLAKCETNNYENFDQAYLEVFLTKKGKLLLYWELTKGTEVEKGYKTFDSLNQFLATDNPPELVNAVMKNIPEIQYEVLDI